VAFFSENLLTRLLLTLNFILRAGRCGFLDSIYGPWRRKL
jgi:hypothetical protein